MKRLINPVLLAYFGLAAMFIGISAFGLPGRSTSPWPWTTIIRNPAQTFDGLMPNGLWQPDYVALKRSINGLAGVRLVAQAGNSIRVALGQSPEWIFMGGRKPIALFLTGEIWVARGSSPRIDAEVDRVAEIIAAYNEQLEREGWKLVVVPVPPKLGVHQEWIAWPISGVDLISRDPLSSDRSGEVYGEFHRALDALKVTNVDLWQVYRGALMGHPDAVLYPRGESHWSGEGIRLAADATARSIASVTTIKARSPISPTYYVGHFVADMAEAYDPLPKVTTRLRSIYEYEDRLLNGEEGRGYPFPTAPTSLVVAIGTSYTGQYTSVPQPVGFAGQLGLHLDNAEVQNRPVAGQGSFKTFEAFWANRREIESEFARRRGTGLPKVLVWEMPIRDIPGFGESMLNYNQKQGWH
ncbi:hypothetical protein AB4Y64_12780 [Lysobacter sp. TAF61]|uniref:alginate O-acetyltransferase AlgX-related protein n=1 Tax=Lysobacter sp. TAF61 TaxID=3233072 RepID=UPI003F9A7B54